MSKLNIIVMAGGWSKERDVSLKSGMAVYEALRKDKYNVSMLDPAQEIRVLTQHRIDVDLIFNLLHGKLGEDGCIQGMLNILNIPYVGSGVLASAVALNKRVSREIYRGAGLLLPKGVALRSGEDCSFGRLSRELGLPMVVKPASEGSSIGISICGSEKEFACGIEKAFACDGEILVEEYIRGREVTCCVLGNDLLETLPLIEIIPQNKEFFDYEAKYTPGVTKEVCPAPIPDSISKRAANCAMSAHRVLGCSVWSRTDMILKGEDVYVLETNTIPGMTENSLFPLAARAGGLSFSDLLDKLISLAMDVRYKNA
jgi:D-alanine-D-alanine ligase